MARLATTYDVFNAVGDPQRRQILSMLARGERSVGEITLRLKFSQPQASKHLRVLREVGLVKTREMGRKRLYSLRPKKLKPIHDWTKGFEKFWNESLDRLGEYLKELKYDDDKE